MWTILLNQLCSSSQTTSCCRPPRPERTDTSRAFIQKEKCWGQLGLLKTNITAEWNPVTGPLWVSGKKGPLDTGSSPLPGRGSSHSRGTCSARPSFCLPNTASQTWAEGVGLVSGFTNEVTSGFKQHYVNDPSYRISMSTNLPVWPRHPPPQPTQQRASVSKFSSAEKEEKECTHTRRHDTLLLMPFILACFWKILKKIKYISVIICVSFSSGLKL